MTPSSSPTNLWSLQTLQRGNSHHHHHSILPTPARRVCRTSCSHAGLTESWLGRSRLLPNCAFQSCCELGVATGLHVVWGHSSGHSTEGIQPRRASLIFWSKGHHSYASAGWVMATRVAAEGSHHSFSCEWLLRSAFSAFDHFYCSTCENQALDLISGLVHLLPFFFFFPHYASYDWMIHLSLSSSACFSPSSTPPNNPSYFHPTHISVTALIQPQTAADSIAKQIIQQQSTSPSPSPSPPLPLSLHSSNRGSLEAEGPYWAGPGLSTIAWLFIEASMGLYAASARPCPRRHQSSSAPGLLSLLRQPANHSLPGSSIEDGEEENGGSVWFCCCQSDLIDIFCTLAACQKRAEWLLWSSDCENVNNKGTKKIIIRGQNLLEAPKLFMTEYKGSV